MALVAFWPTHVDRPVAPELSAVLTFLHHHGVPRWFDYNTVQFSANIILFMPFGALVASMFPRSLWWSSVALGASASFLIEFVQEEFLHGRTADPGDVLSNTIGAAVGGLLAAAAGGPWSTRGGPSSSTGTSRWWSADRLRG
ncbi:VanZ family protein [Curtobacterium ammoniigenes]|uniref:VanZ family protein n=1 Tax=Curtobacterium ammoniigenes TaxID=395387 RepID=UPI001FE109C7